MLATPVLAPCRPAAELRQPLCLVLLRNCASPYDQAVTAAVRLFEAILSAQVGANYRPRGSGKAVVQGVGCRQIP